LPHSGACAAGVECVTPYVSLMRRHARASTTQAMKLVVHRAWCADPDPAQRQALLGRGQELHAWRFSGNNVGMRLYATRPTENCNCCDQRSHGSGAAPFAIVVQRMQPRHLHGARVAGS
jgi:hypothetical protein